MVARIETAQPRLERLDFPFIPGQLHELASPCRGTEVGCRKLRSCIVTSFSIFNSLFVAEMLSGTATTEISQPGRTRLCCVSEFLGNLPIRVSVRMGCAILRTVQSRSGAQNPLDPDVDWTGFARANVSSWMSIELLLRRFLGSVNPATSARVTRLLVEVYCRGSEEGRFTVKPGLFR